MCASATAICESLILVCYPSCYLFHLSQGYCKYVLACTWWRKRLGGKDVTSGQGFCWLQAGAALQMHCRCCAAQQNSVMRCCLRAQPWPPKHGFALTGTMCCHRYAS